MRRSCIAGLFILGLAHGAAAQSENTIEASVSYGSGTGGRYIERSDFGLRLTVSGREWNHGKTFGVYAEGAMDFLAIERFANRGCLGAGAPLCADPYPQFSGLAATVGVTVAPTPHLEFRLGAGGGGYFASSNYAGAWVGQFDVALPGPSIGVVAGVREFVMPSYRGSRLTSRLWSVGMLLPIRE